MPDLPRLAWFTPLPPERSGIATYSAELLPLLADRFSIDVFVDEPGVPSPHPRTPVFRAHDFVWKHAREPYDLVVYQLGNATCHDYMWAYLARYPGLVVLHDAQLHHARGRSLLHQKRRDDYRAELAFDHPRAPAAVAELGVEGLLGSTTYLWPMLRVPVATARLVAVHNAWLARELENTFPDARFETIRMGVSDPLETASPDARRVVLGRHDLSPNAVVFAAYGGVTPEKRIPRILKGFGSVIAVEPRAQLLLVGAAAGHYDALANARERGVADHVTLVGYVNERELSHYLVAADVCLCLRWPSGFETSASWLRCLAAGKPTVITDLAHTGDVPTLVTRGAWSPSHLGSLAARAKRPDPIAVSIDILDEDGSLSLTMRRLARDPGLRCRLGEQARAYWSRRHTVAAMAEDYERALTVAAAAPAPFPGRSLPKYFRESGQGHARALLQPFGVRPDFLTGDHPDRG